MKSPREIQAFLVHRGALREVVALGLHDDRPGLDYLSELRRSNPKGHQILFGQIRLLCNTPEIRTKTTFKLLDAARQLYEFRTRSGLRLYCFLEGKTLVLLTNGGKKNTPREQSRDIQRRDGKREVVLVSRLRPALQRLNPDLPVEAIEGAVEEICRDRTALSLAEANREIDKLLKQGVKVTFPDPENGGQRLCFHERPAFNGSVNHPYFVNPSPDPPRKLLISTAGEINDLSENACHFRSS